MKIQKMGLDIPLTTATKTNTQQAATSTKASVQANTYTSFSSQEIEHAQLRLNQLPDVDMAKVNAVKDALAKGEIKLDIEALSQAIVRFHSDKQ